MTGYREFIEANEAFAEKYRDIINKIANFHGVDISVGTSMLKSNLEFNATVYKGGGVIPTEEWNQMLEDYRELKGIAIRSIRSTPPR